MMSSYRSAARLLAALLSTSVLTAGASLAQTTVTSAPPASFTLGNGMQVVVIPDHRTPVVTEMIWYKVGSADETPGKSGLAHDHDGIRGRPHDRPDPQGRERVARA
jgi:zinc protease